MNKFSFEMNPLLVGFEHLEQFLKHADKTGSDGFPPFNILQTGEDTYRVTLAVAGFGEDDLSVHQERNQLVVRGSRKGRDDNKVFLHKGIAQRQFRKSFPLMDGVEVTSARLLRGLMDIELKLHSADSAAQKINIASGGAERRIRS